MKVAQSCVILCNLMDHTVLGTPGRNTGVGSNSILQWITGVGSSSLHPVDLANAGIKPRSPALWADSLPAEPLGKPRILEWVAYPFSSGSS